MKKKKVLGLILAVSLFVSSVSPVCAVENDAVSESEVVSSQEFDLEGFQEVETKVTQLDMEEVTTELTLEEAQIQEENSFSAEDKIPVIIVFEADSIIEGDAEAEINFVNELKIALLESRQDSVIKKIEKNVLEGEELDIEYQYTWLLNGIATEVPYGIIEEIEAIKGVEKVIIQAAYETCAQISGEGVGQTDGSNTLDLSAYDGKGTKIAVIDTGLDLTHPGFGALDETQLTADSMTKEKLKEILPYLNEYQRYENYYRERIAVEEIYRSSKVPYGFDYRDIELGVGHEDYNNDDHGTHVAGIAAANDVPGEQMHGVAPAAQIYVMKVFGENGNASTAAQLAAVEDAMLLGADVINMSLGSKSGFSSEGEYIDEIFARVAETGTILAIASGNDGTSGDGNNWNMGLSLAENPDNGTVGSPGTYVNALTVANADCTGEEDTVYFSSSRGPSPNLSLEPDIIAPGTSIYSTRDPKSTYDGSMYGEMTGTSMATPYVAGVAALMTQQMKETSNGMSAADRFSLINGLLMSTAEPITYEDIYWSPRSQGAGLVSLEKALETKTYLSVPGMDVPKVELKDDPEKTGSYCYEFEVKNYGKTAAYYKVDTTVQTEQVKEIDGLKFMSGKPAALDAVVQTESNGLSKILDYSVDGKTCTADARRLYMKVQQEDLKESAETFRYDLDENETIDNEDVQLYLDTLTGKADVNLEEEVLKVEPGDAVNVSVSIDVTEDGKAYMDSNFTNGIYVEGYTLLSAQNEEATDMSLPYMGFYGDWTTAPILDEGYYWEDPKESGANYTLNEIYTSKGYYNTWKLGMNPYLEEPFNEKYVSISPNADGDADYIDRIKLSLLRNANKMTITYEGEDGQLYFEETDEKIHKASFGKYYTYYTMYDMTDQNGENLTNNTKLSMKIALTLDYEQEQAEVWETPITIDMEEPQILKADGAEDIKVLADGQNKYIRMKVSDNVGVAAICLLDENQVTYTKYASDHEKEAAEEYQYFDITGIGNKFYVVLGDYAFNRSVYEVETTGNEYAVNGSTLYGYRVADEMCETGECFGWVDISQENAAVKNYSMDYQQNLTAAEYIDGHVVGIDTNGNLVAFEFGKWEERKQIAWINGAITDMAYDPVTKCIYAYESWDYCMLKINPVTGDCQRISDSFVESIVAMTCSDTGTVYAITRGGELKTVDKETGMLSEEILVETGFTPSKTQSMTYDGVQNCIYWACHEYEWSYETHSSSLIRIDLGNDYAVTDLGTIGGNAQIAGLMMLNDRGAGLFQNVELGELGLEQYTYVLMSGESDEIRVVPTPWCASVEGIEWTSQNTDVAEITQNGVVTGKSAGTTTIQLKKEGQLLAECYVKVIEIKAELFGFTISTDEALNNKWIKIKAQDKTSEVLTGDGGEYTFVAAERVNNTIYGYDAEGVFYEVDAASGERNKLAEASGLYEITDMAYDYSNGVMYGVAQSKSYTMDLVQINLVTGEISMICGSVYDEEQYPAPIQRIGVSTEGVIYMISIAGNVCIYDADSQTVMQIGSLGAGFPTDLMSMTMAYDHVNGGIYVIPRSWKKGLSLWYYEPDYGMAVNLGQIKGFTQLNGLHTLGPEIVDNN